MPAKGSGHFLEDIDEMAKTATCVRCGPVRIKRNSTSAQEWRCTQRVPSRPIAEEQHVLSNINAQTRTAHCSVCDGEVDIRKSGSKWYCGYRVRAGRSDHWNNRRTPEQVAQDQAHSREWRLAHPDEVRNQHLIRYYGITAADYDRLLAEQGGGCAICGITNPGRREFFDVDHCHLTGTVRGLLCETHNRGIGIFEDDPELLRRAAEYLERT